MHRRGVVDHRQGPESPRRFLPQSAPRRLAAIAVALFALVGVAASGGTLLDVVQWRGRAPSAQLLAREPELAQHDASDCVFVLLRETTESVAALRILADRDDVAGQRARSTIHHLHELTGPR